MDVIITKSDLQEITPFRILFLHENNFQFVHNKCHEYGWADVYLFTIIDMKAGYGCVWGLNKRTDRDTVFEFYLLPTFRKYADIFFTKLCLIAEVTYIQSQTNDLLLTALVYQYSRNIFAESILFKDSFQTNFICNDVVFEKVVEKKNEHPDAREYLLTLHGEEIANGGLMLNYNKPYADLYYEVKEPHRNKGYGAYMIQELKKQAYLMNCVPAARCNVDNIISKTILLKSGFTICGCIIEGEIVKEKLNK